MNDFPDNSDVKKFLKLADIGLQQGRELTIRNYVAKGYRKDESAYVHIEMTFRVDNSILREFQFTTESVKREVASIFRKMADDLDDKGGEK